MCNTCLRKHICVRGSRYCKYPNLLHAQPLQIHTYLRNSEFSLQGVQLSLRNFLQINKQNHMSHIFHLAIDANERRVHNQRWFVSAKLRTCISCCWYLQGHWFGHGYGSAWGVEQLYVCSADVRTSLICVLMPVRMHTCSGSCCHWHHPRQYRH